MKEYPVSTANLALIRLLVKLNLLPAEPDLKDFSVAELGPLSWFASQGFFDEEDAGRLLAEHLHLDFCPVTFRNLALVLKQFDAPVLAGVTLPRWKELRAVPLETGDGWVKIGMANPLNHEVVKALGFELGLQVQIALSLEQQIFTAIGQKLNSSQVFDLSSIIQDSDGAISLTEADEVTSLESNIMTADISAPPIVRLVNKIFSDAVGAGASDIHISPEKDMLDVRIRVDGILQALLSAPNNMKNALLSRIKLLAGMDISEKRKPQDGRLRIKTGFGVKDLRISSLPSIYGENLVIRILGSDPGMLDFSVLGMKESLQQHFERCLRGSSKVVLVTGPTGSGKTSTLYAALAHLRDGTSNIITVEDPIEYRIPGLNQVQVNSKIGMNFAESLRSILRQDPDVIMVGEIRDAETAAIAMQAAQTGHLVLSTLHTNSAAAAITRLRDLGLPPYLIASSLGAVVAQRLVRRLCAKCSRPVENEELLRRVKETYGIASLRQPSGCDECRNCGYSGRLALYSLLEMDAEIAAAVRSEKSEPELEELARRGEFRTLDEAALELLGEGLTSMEEVERVLGPLHKASAAVQTHSAAKSALSSESGISRRRLLLVEDDENTRTVLNMVLSKQFYQVSEAGNGAEGLERVFSGELPELIVCDVMMPRMDGYQLVARLRADPRTRSIPILMLTAADDEATELECLEKGADDFVSKASDTKIILARVARLLERA